MMARRSLVVVLVAALSSALAATTPVGASSHCPTPQSGTWIGTWTSDQFAAAGSGQMDLTFSGSSVTGTMTFVTGTSIISNNEPITGTVTCATVTASTGTVQSVATLGQDGASAIGTYEVPGVDTGTWRAALVTSLVSGSGTVLTTDTGSGATPSDPVQIAIASPISGSLSIGEASTANAIVSGYTLLGNVVSIVAPPASTASPIQLVFELDDASLGGLSASQIEVFRNGVLVPDCTGSPGTASPDPCVADRTTDGDGDAVLTVLTSTASVWALGGDLSSVPVPDGIAIGDASVVEGNAGRQQYLKFSVTLPENSPVEVTVDYTVSSSGATGAARPGVGVDYRNPGLAKTLRFPLRPNGTTAVRKVVSVPVYPDTDLEGDETISVDLSNASGAPIGRATATGTIIDDDGDASLLFSIGDASIVEGDADKRVAQLGLTLSAPVAEEVLVDYVIAGDTATCAKVIYGAAPPYTDCNDLGGKVRTARFRPNSTGSTPVYKAVGVLVLSDLIGEGVETVTVTLSNARPATPGSTLSIGIGRAVGTVTLLDDD
ncbi:MAG TPA: hypothetical protein VFZ83_15130 [Acidimicrobiia bacterium]|nr:hypothetical protein [Acidimicrobiia bacterium]